MSDPHARANRIILLGIIGAAIYALLFAALYLVTPFNMPFRPGSELTWNDFASNLLTVLAAALCAGLATAIWRSQKKAQPGSTIWGFFARGLWLWALAELLWMIYNLTYVEVPGISLADIPWVAAYFLFSISLDRQYRILYRASRKVEITGFAGVWAGILLGALLITLLVSGFKLNGDSAELFLSFFYILGDLAIAVMSLVLIKTFRGGAMLRPWLGLFVFAFADGLYAWLYDSGMYSYTTSMGNFSSTLADTTYTVAYLVLALALLAHLLLLKYGPNTPRPGKSQSD